MQPTTTVIAIAKRRKTSLVWPKSNMGQVTAVGITYQVGFPFVGQSRACTVSRLTIFSDRRRTYHINLVRVIAACKQLAQCLDTQKTYRKRQRGNDSQQTTCGQHCAQAKNWRGQGCETTKTAPLQFRTVYDFNPKICAHCGKANEAGRNKRTHS